VNQGPNTLATAAQIFMILGDTAEAEAYRRRAQQKASSAPKPDAGSPRAQ